MFRLSCYMRLQASRYLLYTFTSLLTSIYFAIVSSLRPYLFRTAINNPIRPLQGHWRLLTNIQTSFCKLLHVFIVEYGRITITDYDAPRNKLARTKLSRYSQERQRKAGVAEHQQLCPSSNPVQWQDTNSDCDIWVKVW